ncbi:MAG TPA: MBL fold hydrolase [Treponema sp.]|nr:MAG: MBL fold hydrolase [Treponema sp. GWC1_61_84]HCM27016.1 MBL fold hydrolase [Treponema sp.]
MLEPLVVGAIATNCWIVPLRPELHEPPWPRPCAVVDPGGDAPSIIARLRRLRSRPAMVLLTHGHFDHLAALPELLAAFRDDGEPPVVAIHLADAAYLGPQAKAAHLRDFALAGAAEYVRGLWRPMPTATRYLAEGDLIGPFRVLHLPGHTPGSIALLQEGEGILFSGDTLFAGGVGRTDLPGGNAAALDRSLSRLLALPPRTVVHPGHGPSTRVERER